MSTGKRKRSDTKFDSETESVCSNSQFQSPSGGGDIISELRVHRKKQPAVHQIQEKMTEVVVLDKMKNECWLFWKDCILLEQLSQTQQKEGFYRAIWYDNKIAYSWRSELLWDSIKENLDREVHRYSNSRNYSIPTNIVETNLEQLKERVRAFKKYAHEIDEGGNFPVNDTGSDFRSRLRFLFFESHGPLGRVIIPNTTKARARNRTAASSSLSIITHSNQDVVASTSLFHNLLFKPRSNGAKDYIAMSGCIANYIDEYVTDGVLSKEDGWTARLGISKSGFGVGMFLNLSEEAKIEYIKKVIQDS